MNIILGLGILGLLLVSMFIIFIRLKKNQTIKENIVNYILVSLILICYILEIVSKAVFLKYDFNAIVYAFPLRNISPTLFCFSFLIYFLRGRALDTCKYVYSYLSIALIIAGFVCPATLPISYNLSYLSIDVFFSSVAHIFAGSLGLWFVLSRQVALDKNSIKNTLIIIYSLIIICLIINAIFKTNLLGLGMFANYSIYDLVRVEPYILTLLIFVVGVTSIVIISHLLFKCIFNRRKNDA